MIVVFISSLYTIAILLKKRICKTSRKLKNIHQQNRHSSGEGNRMNSDNDACTDVE